VRQQDRRATTCAAILHAAEEEFGRLGFGEAALESVAATAGVSRGALYHHFRSKRALFEAVYVRTERRLCDAAVEAYRRAEGNRLEAALAAYSAGLLAPGVRRIALLDVTVALGRTRARELRREITLGRLEQELRGLGVALDMTHARLVFGAVTEASCFAAESDTLERSMSTILRLVAGARPAAP